MKKVLKVMDSSGDSSVAFDSDVQDAAQSEARVFFDKLMAKGAAVFAIGQDGKGDQRARDFNELAAENVVVPRISGG
jgi:hypothetical protein